MSSARSVLDGLVHASGEVRFWRCADERSEALAIASDIERLIFTEHVQPRSIAVMLPESSISGGALAVALQERAVPHRLQGSSAQLAQAEVRDALAWMRLLIRPQDASATARALLRPPVEMRHVDVAQVVQIARRRRLHIVSALPAAIESPQVAPDARERIRRFLALHGDLASALAEMRPERFVVHLLEQLGLRRHHPLTRQHDAADRAAGLIWLAELARGFERRFPWADARELASHLIALAEAGQDGREQLLGSGPEPGLAGPSRPGGVPAEARRHLEPPGGKVSLTGLSSACAESVEYAYLAGLCSERLCAPPASAGGQALGELLARRCRGVVISCSADGAGSAGPPAELEEIRAALGGQWEQMSRVRADPEQMIEAALRSMRQELLDGVASIGGRLGELRFDTEVDVSHGVVRYLELVKLAALLERAPGQSIAEALADVNSRLLAAVTPLQREILESSTLDEELLAGRAGQTPSSAGRGGGTGEPSLQRFLPRKGEGMLLSASDLETYRSCPLRYKFARVLRIPTEPTRSQRFGIAIHQVLERYHASGGKTLAELMELLEVSWRRSGLGDGDQERRLHRKATAALTRYHERLSEQEAQPVWFERSFSFQLGRHHLRGRVDRIDRLPDGSHELIDYKTGRPKSERELRRDIQLSLYALAATECWQLQSSKQAYHYLLDDVKMPLRSDDTDRERVVSAVLEVGEAIMQERFEPTPSAAVCSICDYRIACPVAEA